MERFKNFINLSKKYVALGLAVTLTLGVLLPVTAVNAQNNESDNFTINELSQEDSLDVREQVVQDLEDNSFIIHVSKDLLDIESATVFEEMHNNEFFKSIVIPIAHKDYNILSNVTIIYDLNFNIIEYTETHITRSQEDTFEIIKFVNGIQFIENITEIEYVTNGEFEESLEHLRSIDFNPRARSIWCVIGVLGVGGVATALLVKFCSVACVTVVGCKPCIRSVVSLAGISTAGIGACFV